MNYPIVIHKDPESDYGVTVPDLPGCLSAGDSLDDALAQATEAIECHLEGLLLDNEAIPLPQNIEAHRDNPDYADGIWALATVDLAKLSGKAKRINITVSEPLLATMDKFAAQQGETRSGLLTRATLEYIATHS